jgi:hypothetical protein
MEDEMERRHNERAALKMNVIVYYQSMPIFVCETSNVSPGGIFIEGKSDLARLDKKSKLEVGFVGNRRGEPSPLRVPAYLAHRERSGVGLKFATTDSGTKEKLRVRVSDERAERLIGYVQ